MCGRYVLRQTDGLQERFGLSAPPGKMPARYNVAPSERMPVIVQRGEDRVAEWMTWGLIPSWSKEPKASFSTFNARAEGIAEKPAFRTPLRRRRCLVPADGFYEWSKTGGRKQPYFIHRPDDQLFAFAGLYDIWQGQTGDAIASFTIVTTTPNDLISPLHDRMAVILSPDDESEWLDPGVTDAFQITRLLQPAPDDVLEVYPVGLKVNRAGTESPSLIAPIG